MLAVRVSTRLDRFGLGGGLLELFTNNGIMIWGYDEDWLL